MQAFLQPQELYQDEYLKLKECGNWLKFLHYYTEGKVRLHQASLCRKHLLCPLCAILRAVKATHAYLDRFNWLMSQHEALRASMVTLTVKNGPDLAERVDHLQGLIRKLNQSSRDAKRGRKVSEWSKVLGLVGSYEVTKKQFGWHPHAHVAVLHREKIWTGSLAKQVHKITGDSNMVDVTPFQNPDDPGRDFVEVFKYALKFGALSLPDNLHAYDVLSGRRMVFSAGLFRGVKIPEDWFDEPLSQVDLPYVEMLYRYFDGQGYQLTEKNEVPF